MALKSKGNFAAFALSAAWERFTVVMFVLMLACIFDDSVSFLPIALFSCWGWFWEWTKKMPFCKPLARDCGTGHSWRLVAVPLGSPEGTAFALILFDVPTIFFLYSVSCAFFWGGLSGFDCGSLVILFFGARSLLFLCLPRVA